MTPELLIQSLQQGSVNFTQTIECIDGYYDFTPTPFQNGDQSNPAGSNTGSCKILAFAQLQGLSEAATLNAFGDYYLVDVLQHPDADDHQNIRNFMRHGWSGVTFEGQALVPKQD
ncbi:type III effector [Nitrincola sp. A-D6]|nr:HopJ type III effector protein [Nitrincola sp. A-D6]KGK43128.1 type III effector [Nitrincola sp. A-D6]